MNQKILLFIINYLLLIAFASCNVTGQISKKITQPLLTDSDINTGHMGICIYDPAANKYLYNYNADKYFIPASNTKLFSLYAGMKYLGDSLVGIRYQFKGDKISIDPTGDPTFLLSEFKYQPVLDFLSKQKKIMLSDPIMQKDLKFMGYGWAWDDYKEGYMAQRSSLPIYGNVVTAKWVTKDSVKLFPTHFQSQSGVLDNLKSGFELVKGFEDNHFVFLNGSSKNKLIPFRPDPIAIQMLLEDTLKTKIDWDWSTYNKRATNIIYSQPSDSLFKPMMYNSDNFFAEQTVLMASNEYLGYMSDEKMIDTILKTSLSDLPQKPKWVDGSGLSRYNLATPQSIVYLLNKMKNEFGLERLKEILPTGGKGTLLNYFKSEAGYIFAKTGTLSNNCALSGFLFTKKGKLLIFSVMNNNYITGATPIRRSVEKFIKSVRENN